ncbi:MAG: ATP-binding protein [Saprospiraceae bacterium]|nr:ATP-binding protein [Saprospiraceae bacterium]
MDLFINRFLELKGQHCMIIGPHGIGKSNYLKIKFPNSLSIDLSNEDNLIKFKRNVLSFEKLVLSNPDRKHIVIDELQKLPALVPVIHKLIALRTGQRFLFSASSIRNLKREDDSLLGESVIKQSMHPFMVSEINAEIEIEELVKSGMMPVCFYKEEKEIFLDAYINQYLEAEVIGGSLIRKVEPFKRFVQHVSLIHGSVLNISKIAKACNVERKTVESYIDLIQEINLGYVINVFDNNAKRRLSGHPKFYFIDSGIYQVFKRKSKEAQSETEKDPAIEGFISQHLSAWIAYSFTDTKLFFWRSQRGLEVHFILHGQSEFSAIHVINSIEVKAGDLRGLKEFRKEHPEAYRFLLYRGSKKYIDSGILIVPIDEFLQKLHPECSVTQMYDRLSP